MFMYKVARLSQKERRALFLNTAQKKGLSEAIIEKDFWVCFMLQYLFHDCPIKNSFNFKGGTSLSKCYNLIYRFSEDIDLVMDWQILGYSKYGSLKKRSKTQQRKFNEEIGF